MWSTKQKRCYALLLYALQFCEYWGLKVRFMTLTGAFKGSDADLLRDFNLLVKRIRFEFGSFEYLRVRTGEGFGVLHVIFIGSFIPQKWLSSTWSELHGAEVVDVRYYDEINDRRFARYIVSQYLGGQSKFIRMSMSRNFVYNGFVSDIAYWRRVCSPKWFKVRWRSCIEDRLFRGSWKDFEEVKVEKVVKYPLINLLVKQGVGGGNTGYLIERERYLRESRDVYGNRISFCDV